MIYKAVKLQEAIAWIMTIKCHCTKFPDAERKKKFASIDLGITS